MSVEQLFGVLGPSFSWNGEKIYLHIEHAFVTLLPTSSLRCFFFSVYRCSYIFKVLRVGNLNGSVTKYFITLTGYVPHVICVCSVSPDVQRILLQTLSASLQSNINHMPVWGTALPVAFLPQWRLSCNPHIYLG